MTAPALEGSRREFKSSFSQLIIVALPSPESFLDMRLCDSRFFSHCVTQLPAASRSRRELPRNHVLGVAVRVNCEQGPRMRKQQRRSQGHGGGGGFGGAWAGSESDTGDKWGRRREGTGSTARDFARKQFQQSFQQSFDFSFQFPSFGDFFNDGFADAPVADTSDRSSDPSYFHKWFPQVGKSSARSRVLSAQ
jgi:hypothetical protein